MEATQEREPHKRVIFDADAYSGDEYFAEGNEKGLWGEWADERLEYTDDARGQEPGHGAWESYLSSVIERDKEEELAQMSAFFAGKKGDMSSYINPYGGNTLIAAGTSCRWDGTRSGFSPYKTFYDAIDTSPSRFAQGNIFADCEIDRIWDENGHLFVSGFHHDGRVTVEIFQLSCSGMDALEAMEDAYVSDGESPPPAPRRPRGRPRPTQATAKE